MTLRLAAATLALLAPAAVEAQTAPELAYGVTVTSNYIDDGATQSDDRPALQGYGEVALGLFYAGAWASTVRIDDDRVELDLYAGIRPSFGDLALDFGYVRYLYDDSGDCCGEVVFAAEHPLAGVGAVAGSFSYDPEFNSRWLDLASNVDLAEVWAVGGAVGTDFGSEDWGDDDKVAWNLGVSRFVGDHVTLDLRFHDSNYDPGRAVLSVSADF